MTTDEKIESIRRNVLRTLADCRGYLLPEPRLIDSVQAALAPAPTRLEIQSELRWLEADAWVSAVRPELGGPPKYALTDRGRAAALAL